MKHTKILFDACEEGGSKPPISSPYYNDLPYVDYNGNFISLSAGGAVWNTVASQVATGHFVLSGAIGTAGCAIYAQQQDVPLDLQDIGCLRSTDLGITWKHVGGPAFTFCDNQISVVGNGAVVYANDGEGNLWKTTDGGDGTLSSSILPVTAASFSQAPGSAALAADDTIFTKLCDTAVLDFRAAFLGCDEIWIDSTQIDSIAPNTYYSILHNRPLKDGSPADTAQIVLVPVKLGTYSITVHGRLRRDDWLDDDTTIHLTLNISPGTLAVTPMKAHDFGAQALCHPVAVRDSFAVSGCEHLTVDSIVFHPDSVQFKDFTFKNTKNFTPDNIPKFFPISFLPSIADTERGSILVYWFDGETAHVDTIRVQGAGVADTRSFSIEPPTLTVRMCDSVTGTIILTNTTCGFLELDSLTLPNGIRLLLKLNGQPQLSANLKSGGSDTLAVELSPGEEGAGTAPLHLGDTTLEVLAHLQFTDGGTTTRFDTTLAVNILVERGVPAALLSDTALDFGTVPGCDSATLPLVLMSTGCDTLSGIGFKVVGNEFRVVGGVPVALPVGMSDTILITYIPKNLTSSDTLTISTNAGTERVTLSGTGSPGASALSANTTPRDFGSLFECEERDTTIWLSNPGCDTLRVDSAVFSNGSYTPDTTLPIIIAKNDSVAVRIHLTSTASTMMGAVTFYSNANSGPGTGTVPLRATAIPPARLQLSLSPTESAKDGQMVTFYLILSGDTGAAAKELQSITFDLSHNNDLLDYLSASGITRVNHPLPPPSKGGGIEMDTFVFTPPPFQGGGRGVVDTIGALTFQVYLTDSSTTPLTLSNISFQTADGLPPDCIASIDSGASGFTYLYQCGNRTLQNFLLTGNVPFSIESIVPNPARTSFEINLSNPSSAPITYTLFDALGNEVFAATGTGPFDKLRAGSAQHVPTDGLPSGTYFLRLSENGYVQSRQISIEH